jgi:hypothetical protein
MRKAYKILINKSKEKRNNLGDLAVHRRLILRHLKNAGSDRVKQIQVAPRRNKWHGILWTRKRKLKRGTGDFLTS